MEKEASSTADNHTASLPANRRNTNYRLSPLLQRFHSTSLTSQWGRIASAHHVRFCQSRAHNFTPSWGATIYCLSKRVSGTTGWRLPSIVELASVLDPSLPAPFVPASVFNGVQLAFYWSATTVAQASAGAYFVNFGFGAVQEQGKQLGSTAHAWCVRGPMKADAY